MKAPGPNSGLGPPGGLSNPSNRPREGPETTPLPLRGGTRLPFPGLGAALTMTAAGRGRVPPAPFPRSPAACRGGGPNCCRCGPNEAPAAPLCSSQPPTSAANHKAASPARVTGRSKPAARARPPFYIRPQATPPHGPLSRRLDP